MIISRIYNIHNGLDRAYIYVWVTKKYKSIYVGMTNDSSGSIGRAKGHFGHKGTFRKRFLEHSGLGIELADDLTLITYQLPKKREYISLESSYREAVEYLFQNLILSERQNFSPICEVVSWHKRTPRRASNSEVQDLAKYFFEQFKKKFYLI